MAPAQRGLGSCDVVGARELEGDVDGGRAVAEIGGQLFDGPDADKASGGEDADPVADALDLGEQVARQQDRQTAFVDEPAEQVEDLEHAERVDRGRRLVEDQQVRAT